MGAAFREQPFAQAQQLSRGGAKRAHLLLDFPVFQNNQQASHHGERLRFIELIERTTAKDIVINSAIGPPASAKLLLSTFNKKSP
jgi:hypothetical protein